jgi:hypothetical protein
MLSNGGEKMGEVSGKTGQVTLGVWYDEEAGDIHLSIPGHGLSTVNGNAESKRGNPQFTARNVPPDAPPLRISTSWRRCCATRASRIRGLWRSGTGVRGISALSP